MKQLKITLFFCTILVVLCLWSGASAADALHRLTHGGQYALALGTVVSAGASTLDMEVDSIVSGSALPDRVRVAAPAGWMEVSEPGMALQAGDYALLSVDQQGEGYTLAWGWFKVSSLEAGTLDVLAGPLAAGDLAALQWYVNSEGKENDFYFIGTNAYVRHADESSTLIYPAEVRYWDTVAEDRPEGENARAIAPPIVYTLTVVGLILLVLAVVWLRRR